MTETEKFEETPNNRYLCFTLAKEKFAIPLLEVKEVIGHVETTSVPQSSKEFKGLINLRGQVIPIMDLRMKLKSAKAETTPETTIIILDSLTESVGVIVDSVDCVQAFDARDISAPPEATADGSVSGIARCDQGLTLILDLQQILKTKKTA